MHVPISANLAIFDDNLIDNNVYSYEPPCLAVYLKYLLDRFMLFHYDNELKFNEIDLLGAYFDLLENRDEVREEGIYLNARAWQECNCHMSYNNDIVLFMAHVTSTDNSTTPTSSTSSTAPSSIATPAAVATTTTMNTVPTFGGDMSAESIMAAIAFLQQAQMITQLKI